MQAGKSRRQTRRGRRRAPRQGHRAPGGRRAWSGMLPVGLHSLASDVRWSFMGRKADPLRDPAPLVRRVYAYVAYRIGDGPEAEDVSSEVFERALRYRWSYNPDKASPITWLMAIARRVRADRGGDVETLVAADGIDRADPLDVEGESVQRLDLQAA